MKKILTAALLTLTPAVALAQGFGQAMDLFGIYGQIDGTPSTLSASVPGASLHGSGGNTNGGVGVFAAAVNNDLYFTHLGFDYSAGAPISGGSLTGSDANGTGNLSGSEHTNGHSLQFNARIGKLFQVAPVIAVGPYLAYQYANFRGSINGFGSASYDNNALGGGVELVTNTGGPFDISAHLGYLAGVSATASDNYGSAPNTPSSGVLQLGARGVYSFTPHFSAFAGVAYDRYHASYAYAPYQLTATATINDVRGMVGLAYNFG